jgi:hypothetical protein
MDNNRIKTIFAIIGVILFLAISFWLGRKSAHPTITTEIRWDTLTIEKPVPYEIEKVRTEYVYVPTPSDTVVVEVADTVILEREVVRVDSILVAVDIERRTYGDERYRAVVSGAVVGDIHPTLESIDIYSKTETRIIEHKAPMFRPYIRGSVGKELMGIGCGVSIKDRVDVDVQYMRMGNSNMVVVGANYRFNIKTK